MTSYKTCAVPMCKSTTIKFPDKLFIHVPKCRKRRKQWLKLARRKAEFTSNKSAIFFCEDHFDLPNDMENYIQYSVMGSVGKIRMKPDCLPLKFQCQPDRVKRTAPPLPRSAVSKRQRMTVLQEIFSEETHTSTTLGMTNNSESTGDTPVPDGCHVTTATHIDYACGACGSRIDGFRYACVQCVDYDQCAQCEASGAHAEHYVLRVPRVERAGEVQTVLDRVRSVFNQANIPVKPKLEEDDDEEKIVVIKEEVEEEEMEPEETDPLEGAGAGVVKREESDTDDSNTTPRGQVPVDETAVVPARVSEASSTRTRTRKASNIRARAGKASGRSAPAAASGPADTQPEADQFAATQAAGAGCGAVKQEPIEFGDDLLTLDRVTEATDVPLRADEASDVQARAGVPRRRPPASEPVNTPAPTGDAGEQPRDSKRKAGASRDENLSELSTFLSFDSVRAPRKRRKTEELGD